MSTRLPICHCPTCNELLDAAFHPNSSPSENDLSVCMYCGAFLKFNEHLYLRLLSPQEISELPSDKLKIMTDIRMHILNS